MLQVAELKLRGVIFEMYDMADMDETGISNGGGDRAAWFKDSEGNIVALIEDIS